MAKVLTMFQYLLHQKVYFCNKSISFQYGRPWRLIWSNIVNPVDMTFNQLFFLTMTETESTGINSSITTKPKLIMRI